MATSRASAVRAVKKYAGGGRFDLPQTPTKLTGTAFADTKRNSLLPNAPTSVNGTAFVDQKKSALPGAPTSFAGKAMNIQAIAGTNPDKLPQPGINWSSRLANTADKLAPYASNIANAFTSPARPEMGAMVSAPKLAMPNYDATRADINASESAFGRSADQSLDANSAAVAKLGARAQTLSSMNKVTEGEGNARASVANQQASLQLQTNYANTQTVNQYKNDLTTFANTAKSAKLANVSNAADKYVAQKNVKAQGELDLKKQAIMSAMYDKGVYDRAMKKASEAGAAAGLKFAKGGMLNQIDATTMMLGRKLKNGGRLTNYTK